MRSVELAFRLSGIRARLGPDATRVRAVGGVVRDALLGRPFRGDVDLATREDAVSVVQDWYARSLVDEPPVLFARFGTAKTRIGEVQVEVAQTRSESYVESSRKPEVMAADWREDALRRDFTVNALYATLDGEVIDLLGSGLNDLRQRVLDTPADPRVTFSDDPLRMFRAIRFRHRLGFEYAPRVWEAIRHLAARSSVLSAERVRDELDAMMRDSSAPVAFQDFVASGLATVWMPELELMRGVEQGSMHHLDVWDHSCLVLAHTISNEHSPSRTLRWAALLHDVAKPNTQTFDEQGSIRFFGHDVVGAAMSFEILARLRFSQSDSEGISQLVRQHMRLGSTARWSDAALRRLIRDLGDQLEDLFALTEADSNALAPGVKTLDLDVIRRGLDDLRARETVSRYESPLRGEQIMAILDIPPGPKVGYWKQRLLTAVLDGVLAPGDADAATRFLLSENTGCG